MKNRYDKIIYVDENGKTIEFCEKESLIFESYEEIKGELIIEARKISATNSCRALPSIVAGGYADVLSCYTDKDGNKAVIPPGYMVSGVKSENTIWGKNVSLVIYRIPKEKTNDINWANAEEIEMLKRTYSQFVWVPVNLLKPNGTLRDEFSNTEKFGRRSYIYDLKWREDYGVRTPFNDRGFFDPNTNFRQYLDEICEGRLSKQSKSVDKYGGFYCSRYVASINSNTHELQFVKNVIPYTSNNFKSVRKKAASFEIRENVRSHLTYGAEYDTVLEWLLDSKTKKTREVLFDSKSWGNYCSKKIATTGNKEKWSACNIYDLAGNVAEWTQERYGAYTIAIEDRIIRGGDYRYDGVFGNVRKRRGHLISYIGFRASLWIE